MAKIEIDDDVARLYGLEEAPDDAESTVGDEGSEGSEQPERQEALQSVWDTVTIPEDDPDLKTLAGKPFGELKKSYKEATRHMQDAATRANQAEFQVKALQAAMEMLRGGVQQQREEPPKDVLDEYDLDVDIVNRPGETIRGIAQGIRAETQNEIKALRQEVAEERELQVVREATLAWETAGKALGFDGPEEWAKVSRYFAREVPNTQYGARDPRGYIEAYQKFADETGAQNLPKPKPRVPGATAPKATAAPAPRKSVLKASQRDVVKSIAAAYGLDENEYAAAVEGTNE